MRREGRREKKRKKKENNPPGWNLSLLTILCLFMLFCLRPPQSMVLLKKFYRYLYFNLWTLRLFFCSCFFFNTKHCTNIHTYTPLRDLWETPPRGRGWTWARWPRTWLSAACPTPRSSQWCRERPARTPGLACGRPRPARASSPCRDHQWKSPQEQAAHDYWIGIIDWDSPQEQVINNHNSPSTQIEEEEENNNTWTRRETRYTVTAFIYPVTVRPTTKMPTDLPSIIHSIQVKRKKNTARVNACRDR